MQSSRRLEREAQRNVELIWLTCRLMPDFKTIADFRKDNGEAIRTACREFVLLCRGLGLFEEATVAIDGSKFKAVNNRDKNFTERKLQARRQQLDESVQRYLTELDRADRDPSLVTEARVEHLKDKLARVKEQMGALRQIAQQLNESPDQQISLTDPDARSMAMLQRLNRDRLDRIAGSAESVLRHLLRASTWAGQFAQLLCAAPSPIPQRRNRTCLKTFDRVGNAN